MTSYIVLGGAGGLILVGLIVMGIWALGKLKKTQFSKAIVTVVVLFNVGFTVAVLYVFLRTGSEPTALIAAWFAFTTAELWSLASITKKKEEIRGYREGGAAYEDYRNEPQV